MLELSETNTRLGNLHSVRELDADGDLLVNAGHLVGGILEGMSDRIMHLAFLGYFIRFCLNLCFFISGHSCHCYRVNLLMRLPVPFERCSTSVTTRQNSYQYGSVLAAPSVVESREVRSSSARLPKQELHALCRTPLSRCSSGGLRPGTKTKGSRNLCYCIPFVSFLKRGQRYHFPISYTRRQN